MTPPSEYWFARRFPIGNPRSGMAPVHWKGWLVGGGFVLGLLAGGAAWAWFALNGQMLQGVASFVVLAFLSGLWFIGMAQRKGDHVNTVADYRGGKLRV